MSVTGLDTPFALVDLDAVERNVERMQRYCDEHGLALRPHIKTHKLPAVAHMQVEAGAVGITCQKLGEAEVMAAAGLGDILISFPLVGEAKMTRLVELARIASVEVVGDSDVVARQLSAALSPHGLEVDFLVECDTGFRRTGVQTPAEAAELATLVDGLPGLRFAGLMTYPTLPETAEWLKAACSSIRATGLEIRKVSSGGTPQAFETHLAPVVTELRVGTYVYGDRSTLALGLHGIEDCAIRIQATVVSRPTRDRAILDCGSKTLTTDGVEAPGVSGFGLIVEYPDADLYELSEEHGHLDVSRVRQPPDIGEIVTVVPNHACACANLHTVVAVHRSGAAAGVWSVAARGMIR